MLGGHGKSNGMCSNPATKLDLDFGDTSRCGRSMDDDTRELITRFTTHVGSLMEDYSVIALTCGRQSAVDLATTLDNLERSIGRMAALASAAKAVLR